MISDYRDVLGGFDISQIEAGYNMMIGQRITDRFPTPAEFANFCRTFKRSAAGPLLEDPRDEDLSPLEQLKGRVIGRLCLKFLKTKVRWTDDDIDQTAKGLGMSAWDIVNWRKYRELNADKYAV